MATEKQLEALEKKSYKNLEKFRQIAEDDVAYSVTGTGGETLDNDASQGIVTEFAMNFSMGEQLTKKKHFLIGAGVASVVWLGTEIYRRFQKNKKD